MLKVYMTGLIYFNGCEEAVKRAYAPDGRNYPPLPPHQASLFIAASQIEESATQWWPAPDFRKTHTVEGAPGDTVIELRLPDPANIWFPDTGNVPATCMDLETKLAKLKKKKHDESEEDFDVDPATAQAIAEVTLRGGSIQPFRVDKNGVVEWTITNHGTLAITAVLKNGSGERTITLKPPAPGAAAEVVFANVHDLFLNDRKDDLAGSHVGLFLQLNPTLAGVTVISKEPTGRVDRLTTGNAMINYMDRIKWTCGVTPGCCRTIIVNS